MEEKYLKVMVNNESIQHLTSQVDFFCIAFIKNVKSKLRFEKIYFKI